MRWALINVIPKINHLEAGIELNNRCKDVAYKTKM